ncbi:ribonucleoprotein PTB-binding 2 [Pristis pectinata]|uniref:ribonucleoprotein PTB-binding 2 n=1 Tax=Pristis pectinata TaxID=685728 RepID=UPI00223E77F9|nr:ribonucleoprotein PTB-binding 2 [Pristis pectinata]
MAARSHQPGAATAAADSGSVLPQRDPAAVTGELPALTPQEIGRRLQRTRRELSNRRKILVKNLRSGQRQPGTGARGGSGSGVGQLGEDRRCAPTAVVLGLGEKGRRGPCPGGSPHLPPRPPTAASPGSRPSAGCRLAAADWKGTGPSAYFAITMPPKSKKDARDGSESKKKENIATEVKTDVIKQSEKGEMPPKIGKVLGFSHSLLGTVIKDTACILEGIKGSVPKHTTIITKQQSGLIIETKKLLDVHELLKGYELKYCYVDKNKGTAFVTLLNGEQAQDAIRKFHKSIFQGREISVLLQPTDSLLCITQLPLSYTQQQFEELVRLYGNLERCFLVYSETTGHSKGYGFVEYMKKDSAARAKSELMGKQLGSCILYVQWTDVDHLSADFLHSKCLCVGKIPHEYKDAEELMQLFSQMFKPVFCQLAQGSGSHPSFAVVEYETADQTELVQRSTSGMLIGGSHVHISFCAPGPPGRSTLAALIAAQRLLINSRKGLLPEPNPLQFMNTLGNPAVLQLLLRPYFNGHAGKKSWPASVMRETVRSSGMLGNTCGLPVLPNPVLTAALLHISQAQQTAALGNGLFQNLLRMQVAQQQLLLNKENPAINNKSSLLGNPSLLLQGAMGLGSTMTSNPGKGTLAESSKGIPVPAFSAELAKAAAQPPVGTLPFWSNQKFLGQDEQKTLLEKPNLVMGPPSLSAPISQAHLQAVPNFVLGGLLASHQKQQTQPTTPVNGTFWNAAVGNQSSLLGVPPNDLKIPNNPYLNFCNMLPSPNLHVGNANRHTPVQQHGAVLESIMNPAISRAAIASEKLQTSDSQCTFDCYTTYAPNCGEYTQDIMQQWYQNSISSHNSSEPFVPECGKEQCEVPAPTFVQTSVAPLETFYNQHFSANANVDYSMAVQVVPSCYAGSQTYFPRSVQTSQICMQDPPCSAQQSLAPGDGILGPAPLGNTMTNIKSPVTGQKRASTYLLPSPEVSPDGSYVGQHSQGLGGHYADSYYKKKRIF